MVDSLSPLPPASVRAIKTHVAEKDPHHQNPEQKHHKKDEDEVKDEVTLSSEAEQENKKPATPFSLHNLDIEA